MLIKWLKLGFTYFLVFQSLFVFGQRGDTSIVLKAVEISASKDKYLSGNKIDVLDSINLSSMSSDNLSNIINNYFPIYVKENAGSLGTIRFRGTSPDHTAVLFNGININSLTLGHSNISNIPSFLFEQIKVQYGSSASLYGSDAIGGSLQLNNIPKWNRGFRGNVQQEFGSFNTKFTGVKIGFSNNKFNWKLSTYFSSKQNDFPFINTAVKDFEKNEYVLDTAKNSAIQNYGFLQVLNYSITNKLIASFNIWYDFNWYEVQPNMSSNYHGGEFTEIKNNHSRMIAGLKYFNGKNKLTFDLGFLNDKQVYNKIEDELIATKSLISKVNYFNDNIWKGNINLGISYQHIVPDVYAYLNGLKESRVDLFCSYVKPISDKIITTINLRESLVENYDPKFTPAIGLNYLMINTKRQNLKINFSISQSYKTPTFNQRYWYPNGNPDILSEQGINYELNSDYKYFWDNSNIRFNLTGYFMEVDNWIQWVNQDVWRPQNIKKVRNFGCEFNFNSEFNLFNSTIRSGLNYSYTNASEVKAYNKFSIYKNKQLIYTPKHISKVYLSFFKNDWTFQSTASYTGNRYTENYKKLEYYILFNVKLGKNIHYKNHKLNLGFSVKNIFNKSYQNWEFYAMPGRNYTIKFNYFINIYKNKKDEKY